MAKRQAKEATLPDVLKSIRNQFRNVDTKCADEGCKLDLKGLEPCVVERPDRIGAETKMCDCLVFAVHDSRHIVVVAELKSGTVRVDHVVAQIREGAKLAVQYIQKAEQALQEWEFYFLCLSEGWHKSDIKAIRERAFYLRKKRCRIRTKKCGTNFVKDISGKKPTSSGILQS